MPRKRESRANGPPLRTQRSGGEPQQHPPGPEPRRSDLGVDASIDEQLGAIDEAGLGAEQERHRRGYFALRFHLGSETCAQHHAVEATAQALMQRLQHLLAPRVAGQIAVDVGIAKIHPTTSWPMDCSN